MKTKNQKKDTMQIYYGITDNSIEVTEICLSELVTNNVINIPRGDVNRARFFSDPLPGIFKQVIILQNGIFTEYDAFIQIKIDLINNTVTTLHDNDVNEKLSKIHSSLKFRHGSLHDEIPEQKMVVRYLTGNEKVLEIGGNVGRNSLVIASILQDSANLVTLECDVNIANQLTENRDLNNFKFHVECAALSNRKLIQKNWDTIPSDTLQEGYNWVNTITYDDFKTKYNIEFDTLVLDCEGAFYYILMDMPDILNHISIIIMENDYNDIAHKNYIDDILKKNNFSNVFAEGGGWGPCQNNFFEVWTKNVI